MSSIPASEAEQVGQLLSAAGQTYSSELIMTAADTGLPWRVRIAGDPPELTFTAVPSCAEIADSFASCQALANAVARCTDLLAWGF